MIEYLKKKLEELIEDLLEPFWLKLHDWVINLSWRKRIVVLIVVVLAVLLVIYADSLPLWVGSAVRVARVGTSEATQVPLSTSLTNQLHETAKRLSGSLQSEINNPHNISPESPWALAQAIIASNRLANIDRDKIQEYLRSVSLKTCNCWQEIPVDSNPPLIPASGWVIFALAEMGIPATDSEINFFLNEQHRDGWWSLFPVSEESQYASTYGTAWAVLGLQNQLSKNLVSKSLATDTAEAIANASAWLISHREDDGIHWKNYPLLARGQVSESISGLVLHVLHETLPNSLSQINKTWLDKLPPTVPLAGDFEQNFYWVITKNYGYQNDKFVQIKLPWLLIATVDAYPDGDFFQRVEALGWLEKALEQESVLNAERQPDNWWRAELLLAIEYVLKRTSKS